MASPDFATKLPEPVLATVASTYPLFTASPDCEGAGRIGDTANCFAPVIVSVPFKWTTLASAVLTYASVANWLFPAPDVPTTVRTCAIVSGELVPTDQFSALTVPSLSW